MIKESLEGKLDTSEVSAVEYVMRLKEKTETLCSLVNENMTQIQAKQKLWYDLNVRQRVYEAGKKVLVLVPMQNKLQVAIHGI